MSKLVLVISKTGTGKSSSMRNFTREEAAVILCSGKELPFRNNLKTTVPNSASDVLTAIANAPTPAVIIDDANYLMSFEEMARVNETGYAKFTQMANNMLSIFKAIIAKPGDQIFYIMAHAADTDDGTLRFKTTGKMLSDKIVLEGLSNIVITTEVSSDGEFLFRVQTDGSGIKTPIGMFETPTIENDLKLVDTTIREYYGMNTKKAAAPKATKPATN